MNKKYIKPKYAEHSDEKLEHEIMEKYDIIQYVFRRNRLPDNTTRRQLEDMHEMITSLYWLCFDLYK